MTAYYNEIDPSAAAWLRELIADGLIAPGDVDERSIEDVRPDELAGYTQCHFFAGIGGWSLALRLAGWPDDKPIWTGSCPCQPFSAAGKGDGFADERHLWPAFHWLIQQCGPPVVAGEQVASKAVEPWIDLVQTDMEGLGYAFAGIPFPSASVGAPHIRDRLFLVADAEGGGRGQKQQNSRGGDAGTGTGQAVVYSRGGDTGGMGHPGSSRRQPQPQGLREHGEGMESTGRKQERGVEAGGNVPVGLADTNGDRCDQSGTGITSTGSHGAVGNYATGGLADADSERCREARQSHIPGGRPERPECRGIDHRPGPTNGFWADADWLHCRDGKWRPVEPGTFPLVDGLPRGVVPSSYQGMAVDASRSAEGRMMRLRGYGNAIVPQQAAELVRAFTGGAG